MIVITWKFDDSVETMSVKSDSFAKVVLSNGQITMMIDQKKMVQYLEWILHQELKNG